MKNLAFSWHGPYRISSKVGENAHKVAILTHPDKLLTVNVNRLKKFGGKWTRPFLDEVPPDAEETEEGSSNGPLDESDLPPSSFVERLTVGREDTVLAGVETPLLKVVAKRIVRLRGCLIGPFPCLLRRRGRW